MILFCQKNEVAHAFFILLLLVIIGEFFSSPAIMFADSVTLSFLGDDTQNYGRQRMFGSLGKKHPSKHFMNQISAIISPVLYMTHIIQPSPHCLFSNLVAIHQI